MFKIQLDATEHIIPPYNDRSLMGWGCKEMSRRCCACLPQLCRHSDYFRCLVLLSTSEMIWWVKRMTADWFMNVFCAKYQQLLVPENQMDWNVIMQYLYLYLAYHLSALWIWIPFTWYLYLNPNKIKQRYTCFYLFLSPWNLIDLCHAGPEGPVTEFVSQLQSEGVFAKEVKSAGVAFHSKYMANIAPQLQARLKEVKHYCYCKHCFHWSL